MAKVFVVDAKGSPCLPCQAVRARRLLQSGRAKVHSVVPFTIMLHRVVKEPAGSFVVGIDDGAKEVGLAVINKHNKEAVFEGQIHLRQDVSKKMLQRSQYRRTRRGRKARHREARFDNRGKSGRIAPTIKQKKDSILRVIADLKRRVAITTVVVEQGEFDTSSVARGRELTGVEYQQAEFEGRNFRAKILWRDGYICQRPGCGGKDTLQAHHINPKSNGGTNTTSNGITLCKICHEALHRDGWKLLKKPKHFKYPAHLQVGKHYLTDGLEDMGLGVNVCFGWMTKKWRDTIGLPKTHINDAAAMACKSFAPSSASKQYLVLPKRKKVWDDNPTKTCSEKKGFRHCDVVKAKHRTRGQVIGSIRSLKKSCITLRTLWDDNFPVAYSKARLLWRFKGIVYI
jgi:hypothetical protein